jgi:hypothetical protein
MNARKWIVVSGVSWLVVGSYLMVKGLNWVALAMVSPPGRSPERSPLIQWLSTFTGSVQQGALILICAALFVGFIKGRLVLSKTVHRVTTRLRSEKSPIHFSRAYDRKYYVILGSMMGLGLLFRFLPIAFEIRGAIDVTIGSALINGAMLYFRQAVFYAKA